MYLSVVGTDGRFTGVQYMEDTQAIRNHHAIYGQTLIWLDNRLENIGTDDEPDYGEYTQGMESSDVIDLDSYLIELDYRLSMVELGLLED